MDGFFVPLEHHSAYFQKHGQMVNYRKGEYLANSHDLNSWVFFLEQGLVSVGFNSENGDGKLIGYFIPGMTFAQSGSFFETFSTVRLDYRACEDCRVFRLPREDFLHAVQRNKELSQDYVSALLRNQIFLVERIVYQSEKGIYNKCVHWLLFMAKFYGQRSDKEVKILPPITQEIAANFMNVTRESVASALTLLKKRGLITVLSKRLTIHNIDLLQKELR